jgi:hypothetical protein
MKRQKMTMAAMKRSPFGGGPRYGGPENGRPVARRKPKVKALPMSPAKDGGRRYLRDRPNYTPGEWTPKDKAQVDKNNRRRNGYGGPLKPAPPLKPRNPAGSGPKLA